MSIDTWIDKEDTVYTYIYVYVYIYIYINITQELNNATTLMQLEIILLSKVSQKEKNKYPITLLIHGI